MPDPVDKGTGLDIGSTTSKPFIRVASKSTGDSIYGISKHNRIVFTPLFR